MTVYNWSTLSNNQSIAFSPTADRLTFDDLSVSAASLVLTWVTGATTFSYGGKAVTLQTDVKTLTTTNLTFANASQYLVGDNTTGTTADDLANLITGTSLNDAFLGLGGNDTINAGGGNDVIITGYYSSFIGNDMVNGGAGNDALRYPSNSTTTPPVTVNLATHTATSAQGTMTLSSIEEVSGTSQNDTFIGGDPAHAISFLGNATPEVFRGEGGNDTITGGSVINFYTAASYADNASNQGIIANLHTGVVLDGRGGIDTLNNVQAIWGGAGDDQLIGGGLSRNDFGVVVEVFRGGAGNDTIYAYDPTGDGYRDEIADYSGNTSDQPINANLATGLVSDGLGGTDKLTGIGYVFGGAGNDTITGGSAFDFIDGGAGNDLLDGGASGNAVLYWNSNAGVIVNLSSKVITVDTSKYSVTGLSGVYSVDAGSSISGSGSKDTLKSFITIEGSNFDDYLQGVDGYNGMRQYFNANAGNNTILAGAAPTTGIAINPAFPTFANMVSYWNAPVSGGGIYASLAPNTNGIVTIRNPWGGIDTVVNMTGIEGTNGNDTLIGSAGNDQFLGLGGSDIIDGGPGNDWYVSSSPSAVYVNLTTGRAVDGFDGRSNLVGLGGIDTLINIENIDGSGLNDILIGDSGNNIIRGNGGADLIDGGDGIDTATYNTPRSQYVVTSQADGSYTVRYTTSSGVDGTDTLRNIEFLAFTDGTVAITAAAISGDIIAPVIQSASVNGSTLTLTYSESLDPTHQPNLAGLSVSGVNYNLPVLSASISGSQLKLTLAKPVLAGDSVTVSYNDASVGNDAYAIQDLSGNDAASLANYAITNSTSTSLTSTPAILSAFFTEPTSGTNTSTITLNFSNAMVTPTVGNAPTFSKNGSTSIAVTGVSTFGHAVTFTTNTLLSAGDYITVNYDGSDYLKDATGQSVWSTSAAVGGSGSTKVDGNYQIVFGNAGNDILSANNWGGSVYAGAGSDQVSINSNNTQVFLGENIPASDTVIVGGGSDPYAYATVFGFDASDTATADKLQLRSSQIAIDATYQDGVDINGLKSHSISSGIVTFLGTDFGGAPILINQSNLLDAETYLSKNIKVGGITVGFYIDTNNDGFNDSLGVFTRGQDAPYAYQTPLDNNEFVMLAGLVGVGLSNSKKPNTVELIPSTEIEIISFRSSSESYISAWLNKSIVSYDASGALLQVGHGSTLDALPNSTITLDTNYITLNFGRPLGQNEFVVWSETDRNKFYAIDSIGTKSFLDGGSTSPSLLLGKTAFVDMKNIAGKQEIGALNRLEITSQTVIGNDEGGYIKTGYGNDVIHGGAGDDELAAMLGDDALYGHAGNDELNGSLGADYLDGGTGHDSYGFRQGDSPLTSFLDSGIIGLNTGDMYNLPFGVDVITGSGFSTAGDQINFYTDNPKVSAPTSMGSAPTTGLVTDQKYFTVQGNYINGSFTVDTTAGKDTLIVYDGDSTSGVTQTAIVVTGVVPSQFTQGGLALATSVADTFAPMLPTTYVDGNTINLIYNEDLDTSHLPSMNAFSVNLGGSNRAINWMAVSSDRVTLTLATPVSADDVVTVSYVDPTTGNDVNAIQDQAGNDAGSFSGLAVRNITTTSSHAPTITSSATASTPENVSISTPVYTITATDPDANTTLAYSISGGADAALFKMDVNGAVTFKASPNFEAPADAGKNNVYDIIVRASDGPLSTDKVVAISVTDVFEPTTGSLHGVDYFWKPDTTGKHALLGGVTVNVTGGAQPAEGANAPVQFKNIIWDATGHATVEVFAHVTTPVDSIQINLGLGSGTNAAFSTALPTDWTLLGNPSSGEYVVAGYSMTALATGDLKLGTLSFDTGSAAQMHLAVDAGSTLSSSTIAGSQGTITATPYGFTLAHASTGADGAYTVAPLDLGAYAVTATRSTSDMGAAITSADALAALKIAVGMNPNPGSGSSQLAVSPFQIMSADANQDGKVTSADALAILKMAVHMTNALAPEWMFVEETRDLSAMTRTNAAWDHNIGVNVQGDVTANLVGLIKGDVNGSWAPPAGVQYVETLHPTYFTDLSNTIHAPVSEWGVL